MLLELDLYEGLHVQAKASRIDDRSIAFDHTGLFQRTNAPGARGLREADGLGQFHDRKSTVCLQRRQDAGVEAIKLHMTHRLDFGVYPQNTSIIARFMEFFTYFKAIGSTPAICTEKPTPAMNATRQALPVSLSGAAPAWRKVVDVALLSRALDELEESTLTPARKVLYQFSARGHEVTQALLAQLLTGQRDGVASYYRSRPLLLALGFPLEEALSSTMMRSGGLSDGRDIGVVFNLPNLGGPCVLPACGGVGTQYTPAVGWAQALRYHSEVLRDDRYRGSIALAHGGDASTATNGFWAALNIATTQRLPMLFYIEDNGYGISVRSTLQTPGGNIAKNLSGFSQLKLLDGDGSDPVAAAGLMHEAVATARTWAGPVLLRLVVPRLSGHSGQDTQAYKSAEELTSEQDRDPLKALRLQLVPAQLTAEEWIWRRG